MYNLYRTKDGQSINFDPNYNEMTLRIKKIEKKICDIMALSCIPMVIIPLMQEVNSIISIWQIPGIYPGLPGWHIVPECYKIIMVPLEYFLTMPFFFYFPLLLCLQILYLEKFIEFIENSDETTQCSNLFENYTLCFYKNGEFVQRGSTFLFFFHK